MPEELAPEQMVQVESVEEAEEEPGKVDVQSKIAEARSMIESIKAKR